MAQLQYKLRLRHLDAKFYNVKKKNKKKTMKVRCMDLSSFFSSHEISDVPLAKVRGRRMLGAARINK